MVGKDGMCPATMAEWPDAGKRRARFRASAAAHRGDLVALIQNDVEPRRIEIKRHRLARSDPADRGVPGGRFDGFAQQRHRHSTDEASDLVSPAGTCFGGFFGLAVSGLATAEVGAACVGAADRLGDAGSPQLASSNRNRLDPRVSAVPVIIARRP